MGDYDLYQVEVTKNYALNEWREDLQKIFRQTGINGTQTTFLFGDHQIRVCLISLFVLFIVNRRGWLETIR